MGKSIMSTTSTYFVKKVRSFDMYPNTINFTFKGESEFKTIFGGIVSLFIKVIIFYYAYLMIRLMIERENTSKSVNTVVRDILNDDETTNLNDTDFSIAFSARVDDNQIDLLNNEYISVDLVQYFQDANGEITETSVEIERCGDTLFNYYNQTEVNILGINSYFCPTSTNFNIRGTHLSSEYLFFEFNVVICQDDPSEGITCPVDLEEVVSQIIIDVPFVNTYFDFDDYEYPVKTYIDGRFSMSAIPELYQIRDVYIQVNEAEFQDSYFAYQPGGHEDEFVGIERVDNRLVSLAHGGDDTLIQMNFRKDSTSRSFERQVFSFMEVTGNIGGLFEIFAIGGEYLVGIFSARLFMYSLLSKLYHVDLTPRPKEQSENGETEERKQQYIKEEGQDNLFTKNAALGVKASCNMKHRFRYDWKISDFLYNLFSIVTEWFFCCCRSKSKLHAKKRFELYNKGETMFTKEFDAVYYAKCMRNLNTLVTSMMDDSEKVMINYQNQNAIPFYSDVSSEERDRNFNSIPKIYGSQRRKDLHQQKVEFFMEEYARERWTEKDFKLLNGVFSKDQLTNDKIKEFEEKEANFFDERSEDPLQSSREHASPFTHSEERKETLHEEKKLKLRLSFSNSPSPVLQDN